jgi:Na+/melibiose symporter-like transporter
MKADPRDIMRAHFRTLVDARTGKTRPRDYVLFFGFPSVVAAVAMYFGVDLGAGGTTGLLTISGILSAFLFGVMMEAARRAMNFADSHPPPGLQTSAQAQYLEELAANAGYASIASILAAIAFVITGALPQSLAARIATALGLALGVHLALTLLMIMRRVFALTQERLNHARTGADRDDTDSEDRRS